MKSIAILGPESSGKTTLANRLVQEHPGWILVPEAARTLVEQQGYRYTEEDVLRLAKQQIRTELRTRAVSTDSQPTVNRQSTDSQPTVNRQSTDSQPTVDRRESDPTAVFDTELIITKVWLLDKYGRCPRWIDDHIRNHPHDLYLLCAPDIPAVADPARENLHRRQELFRWYERELQAINANYQLITH